MGCANSNRLQIGQFATQLQLWTWTARSSPSTTLFLAIPSLSWFKRPEVTVQVVVDGNAYALFSGAALVNARQLLCVRPAEGLRQLETGQASDVLHCDELEAGLPVPGHASGRVRDGPSLPLTAAVIDTAAQADLLGGRIHDYERAARNGAGSSFSQPTRNRRSHNTTRAANVAFEASRPAPEDALRTVLSRHGRLPLHRLRSTPKSSGSRQG